MRALRHAGWATLVLASAACAGGGGDAPPDRARIEAEVTEVAETYYDAFRLRRLDEASALVADRVLPSRRFGGVNVRDQPSGEPRLPDVPAGGPALVRQRRRGWTEFVPRDRWSAESVFVDGAGERARVDTSGEGSYWMRRLEGRWRIVGFGILTDESRAEFGGEWPDAFYGR